MGITDNAKFYHSNAYPYVFVLWADKFEEFIATAFVIKLRQKGFRVKVVGLRGKYSTGAYGLILGADLTLGQALPLARNAICVIVPCDKAGLKHLENDPRLHDFFAQIYANKARVVLCGINKDEVNNTELLNAFTNEVVTCPEDSEIIGFAHEVAASLSQVK